MNSLFVLLSTKDDEAYIKSGTTMLRVRDSAGGDIMKDEAGNPVYLSGDTRVTVIDSTNSAWYKITFSYNGAQLEGYVSSSYVVMGSPEPVTEAPVEAPTEEAAPEEEDASTEQPTETEAETEEEAAEEETPEEEESEEESEEDADQDDYDLSVDEFEETQDDDFETIEDDDLLD